MLLLLVVNAEAMAIAVIGWPSTWVTKRVVEPICYWQNCATTSDVLVLAATQPETANFFVPSDCLVCGNSSASLRTRACLSRLSTTRLLLASFLCYGSPKRSKCCCMAWNGARPRFIVLSAPRFTFAMRMSTFRARIDVWPSLCASKSMNQSSRALQACKLHSSEVFNWTQRIVMSIVNCWQ